MNDAENNFKSFIENYTARTFYNEAWRVGSSTNKKNNSNKDEDTVRKEIPESTKQETKEAFQALERNIIYSVSKRYNGESIRIVSDPTKAYPALLGKSAIVLRTSVKVEEGSTPTNYRYSNNVYVEDAEGRGIWIEASNVIIESELTKKAESGLKKRKKNKFPNDEFGPLPIISLSKRRNSIYLSSYLRLLMDLEDGDKISFAVDEDNKVTYICKDPEGYEIDENSYVNSSEEWKRLRDTYNDATSDYTTIHQLSLSPYVVKDEEMPEYDFYAIEENWFTPKKKKNKTHSKKAVDVPEPQFKVDKSGYFILEEDIVSGSPRIVSVKAVQEEMEEMATKIEYKK